MINNNHLLKFTALVFAFSVTQAMAEVPERLAFADELDACVAALNDELDLRGVYKVRHIVTKSNPRGHGFALRIRTETFAPNTNKHYSVSCVASGKNLPTKLQVAEINT
jgi:hypothetical protein